MEPDVIGDRYELREPVGRGGMATIYQAVDLRMGRTVAIKILREVYSSDPKFVTRFQREARAASMLQHPNIVQVFDFGQSNGNYYIVMEFVQGEDLRHVIKREGILATDRAAEIAHDVALGLGLAHRRGIVHRDVKPQNILINSEGLVKLTDFGIASVYKDADAERLTTTGMTLGTVQYYAPEQAQGEVVAPAADVYALGIVLYEMLTGRTPFDGDTPVAVAMKHIQELPEPPTHFNPRIPPAIERIIMRCLEKDPRDRYRDGDALAYAIEQALNAPGVAAARRPAPPAGGRAQFGAMVGLPSTNGYGPSSQPAGNGRPGAYAGPALASGPGPRGGMRDGRDGPRDGRYGSGGPGLSDDQTYDGPPDELPLGMGFNGGPGGRPFGAPAGPSGTPPRIGAPGGPRRPDDPGKNKRNTALMTTLVIGVVLFLLLACSLAAFATGLPNQLGTMFNSATPTATVQLIPVPQFVGSQYTSAQQVAQQIHLNVKENMQKSSQKAGTVLQQDTPVGKEVPAGTTVTLTVSSGLGQVKVPTDLANGKTSYSDACNEIGAVVNGNLHCYVASKTYSQTVPIDDVISTDPAPGAMVAPGTTINLTVSLGPQPTPTVSVTASPTPTCTPLPSGTPPPTVGGTC